MPKQPEIAKHSHVQNEGFSQDETSQTDRIVALAGAVFGDPEKALLWLSSPDERLACRAPLDVLHSKSGSQIVESMLWQLDEGIYT
jgi:putative toxin-antitoxin system antitoxin component (TIGR02293 family)